MAPGTLIKTSTILAVGVSLAIGVAYGEPPDDNTRGWKWHLIARRITNAAAREGLTEGSRLCFLDNIPVPNC